MLKKILRYLTPPIIHPSLLKEQINKLLRDKDVVHYEVANYNRLSFIFRALLKFDKRNVKYLEIGVESNSVFNSIYLDPQNKIGVDPNQGGTHRMTSDEFFLKNKIFFDVIFIDGLHHYEQCQRDCINSLKFLKPNGIILLHDLLPKNSFEEHVPRKQGLWTGDVWKVAVELQNSHLIDFCIANIDMGVGIAKPKENYSYKKMNELKNMRFRNFSETYYKILPIKTSLEALEFIDN